MNEAVRTFAAHEPIDVARAERQHEAYRAALEKAGAEVRVLDVNAAHPDCVFIEDTAVVLDELAVITVMGAPSRADEPAGIASELARHREMVVPLRSLNANARLEGGDVVRLGKVLLVALTARTNAEGVAALADIVKAYDYEVRTVGVRDCLHLKSACTALPSGALLINPSWIDPVSGFDCVPIAEDEPNAANVVAVGPDIVMSSAHPYTAERIASGKYVRDVHTVDLSEMAKADGCATCLSLLL